MSYDSNSNKPNEIDNSSKRNNGTAQDINKKRSFPWFKIIFLIFVIVLVLYALLKLDITENYINNKIEQFLAAKIDKFATVQINGARIAFDNEHQLAIKLSNIDVNSKHENINIDNIGHVQVSIQNKALLKGKIKPNKAELDTVSIIIDKNNKKTDLISLLPQDSAGRVSFDGVTDLIFNSLETAIDNLDKTSLKSLFLKNVTIIVKNQQREESFTLKKIHIDRSNEGLDLKGYVLWRDQSVELKAQMSVLQNLQVKDFLVSIKHAPIHIGANNDAKPYLIDGRPNNGFFRLNALGNLVIEGSKSAPNKKEISSSLSLDNALTDVSIDENIPTKMNLKAKYDYGTSNLSLLPSKIVLGNVELPLTGNISYLNNKSTSAISVENSDKKGYYSFNLKAQKAHSAPEDSPSKPLSFAVDLNGDFSSRAKNINLETILLTTPMASIKGTGRVIFGQKRWPELIFIISSDKIAIDDAKQLWPINVARGGRKWIISHVFGGILKNAHMEITMPEGFHQKGKLPPLLTEKELRIKTNVEKTKAKLIGNLPSLTDASGHITVKGTHTDINLNQAYSNVTNDEKINIYNGLMSFTWIPGQPLWASAGIYIDGNVRAIGNVLGRDPVNALKKIPFDTQKAKGNLRNFLKLFFPIKGINKADIADAIDWDADITFDNFSLGEPYHGTINVKDGEGKAHVNKSSAQIDGTALLNSIPASIKVDFPLKDTIQSGLKTDLKQKKENIVFHVNDKLRNQLAPALDIFLKGNVSLDVGAEIEGKRPVKIDLAKVALQIPWIGWEKGKGIPSVATMSITMNKDGLKNIDINDFVMHGPHFNISGQIKIRDGKFVSAYFNDFKLNEGDQLSLKIKKIQNTYQVNMFGKSFDMRSFINNLSHNYKLGGNAAKNNVVINADIKQIKGFNKEIFYNFQASYQNSSKGYTSSVKAQMNKTANFKLQSESYNKAQTIYLNTHDAGSLLRFMNYYSKVKGGKLNANLTSQRSDTLKGNVDINDFAIINEDKLKAMSTSSRDRKNTTTLKVDNASANLIKKGKSLVIDKGVIRGPSVGAVFQGKAFDASGNIDMTGTYMPAYSLNRVVGYVPVLGDILGNGNDKGFIGLTFKLEGKTKSPRIIVNPISVIAPGVLRSIFEFRSK